MPPWLESGLIAAAGTLAYELVRLYELMGKLPAARFRRMIKGPYYLPVTAGLVAGSAILAAAFIQQFPAPPAWQIMATAIGMRAIVIKPVEVRLATRGTTLGSAPTAGELGKSSVPKPAEERASLADLFV